MAFGLFQGVEGHNFGHTCVGKVFCIDVGHLRVVKLMGLGLNSRQCSGFGYGSGSVEGYEHGEMIVASSWRGC